MSSGSSSPRRRFNRRKRRGDGSPNPDRWLVSYADFITLLFAFFVVMYSISQADLTKFKKVSESIKGAFGASSGDLHDSTTKSPGGGRDHTDPNSDPGAASVREELQNLQNLLNEMVKSGLPEEAEYQNILQTQIDGTDLTARLSAEDLFLPGRAEIAPDLRVVLDRVGMALLKTGKPIQLRGYADPDEIKGSKYASSWELGSARALWVARYLMERHGFKPEQLSIASFGQFHPITGASGEWQSSRNRRVEITISKEKTAAFVGGEAPAQ